MIKQLKIFIPTALLLTMFSCLQAQNDAGIRYNREIWKAEMAICHSKYDSAFVYYDKAFRIHRGWNTDYQNYALLAIKLEKPDILYPCLDTLASKGYSLDDFHEFVPEKYANGYRWDAFCRRIDSYNRQFDKRNAKVKAQLDSIEALDQKYAGDLPNDSITLVYHKIVYQNGITIIDLINSGCMPVDNIYRLRNVNATQIPLVLVHHYIGLYNQLQQKGNCFTNEEYKRMDFNKNNLEVTLLWAIQQGLMTPYSLVKGKAAWTSEENPYNDAEIQTYNGESFTKKLDSEKEVEINNNREKLGLGSLSENRVRASAEITVNGYPFLFFTGTQVKIFLFKNPAPVEGIKKDLLGQGWIKIN